MLRLKYSGYGEKYRTEVLESAYKTFEKQLERERNNICPLYRPKGFRENERKSKKNIKKVSWQKPNDTVLFVPPTPNSELANKIKKITEETKRTYGLKVKVVERAGKKIQNMLPGLQTDTNCERGDCIVHQHSNSEKKLDCNIEGIVYQGICRKCKENGISSVYIGETSRSMYVRGKEHLNAIGNPTNHKHNAFAKHIIEQHSDEREDVKFDIDIIGSFKRPLQRQIREGVEIINCKGDIIMNSKIDHFQPAINRMSFRNMFE